VSPFTATRDNLIAILTGVLVVAWICSAVVRIWVPWPEAAVLDGAMPLVIGFFFVHGGLKKGNAPSEQA
jgi:hypothetical protein